MPHLTDVQKLGQSIWLDFIQRRLITSSELAQLVSEGLRGITSNPTIFHNAIAQSNDYDGAIRSLLKLNPNADANAVYERLAVEDIRMAADILRPVYDASGGLDGLISLEVSPYLAGDTGATIVEARRLWQLVDRPNLMIKVPSTAPGIPAIETLIAEGININITLLFSLKHYEAVSHAYIRGVARNSNPERLTSVASFFVSRVDTRVDQELERIGTGEARALRGKAAIANSKVAYRRFREIFFGDEFAAQRQRGARIQRVLWGSTGTKNPAYSDVLYAEGLMGADTINTLPLETIDRLRNHGKVHPTLQEGTGEAERVLSDLTKTGVNLDAVTEQLQKDGVKAFVDSFDKLLDALEEKRKELLAAGDSYVPDH